MILELKWLLDRYIALPFHRSKTIGQSYRFQIDLPEDSEMKLKTLDQELSVCKVVSISDIDLNGKFFFVGKTDEEISLVCLTSDVPDNTTDRADGWNL